MARARRWTCTTINDDGSISYYLFHGDSQRTAYLKITKHGNMTAEIGVQKEEGIEPMELLPDESKELQAEVNTLVAGAEPGGQRASKLWATLYRYWKGKKK